MDSLLRGREHHPDQENTRSLESHGMRHTFCSILVWLACGNLGCFFRPLFYCLPARAFQYSFLVRHRPRPSRVETLKGIKSAIRAECFAAVCTVGCNSKQQICSVRLTCFAIVCTVGPLDTSATASKLLRQDVQDDPRGLPLPPTRAQTGHN